MKAAIRELVAKDVKPARIHNELVDSCYRPEQCLL
ncbi:hypothetical protein L917_21116 [Phytophthora nicotianae]|uniref:Uncharacterized protein n=1 Tax=Phytophthora nicotianae TaxID=4792 RepID=W2JYL4_PHYNI|nr:hypothetical protein L917_21116 [Phytophthora nicotianae]